MTIDPDIYLLKQVAKGDGDAFEFIFKKYYKLVYNVARYYINLADVCHDLTQDIFAYIWENRTKTDVNQSLKSYLFSAARNASLNYLKAESNKRRHLSNILQTVPREEDGYDTILEEALKEALEKVLNELPPQCSEIFRLSRMKGMKHKEIATLLNISPRTVETQIYRALKVLKKRL